MFVSIFLLFCFVFLILFFCLCFFFFFFQAEDGIRDLYVTGVQTCALPISQTCDRSRGSFACRSAESSTRVRGRGGPPVCRDARMRVDQCRRRNAGRDRKSVV